MDNLLRVLLLGFPLLSALLEAGVGTLNIADLKKKFSCSEWKKCTAKLVIITIGFAQPLSTLLTSLVHAQLPVPQLQNTSTPQHAHIQNHLTNTECKF